MDKKKGSKDYDDEDIKGFEEFIEGQPRENNFIPRGLGGGSKKNDSGFEHFTFLANDGKRLMKLKYLLSDQLPFTARYEQGERLIQNQKSEVTTLRKKIFTICDKEESSYRKSAGEIFNSYFKPVKDELQK